jgi:hypothetical protein
MAAHIADPAAARNPPLPPSFFVDVNSLTVIPALYTRKATLSLQSGRLRWKWRSSATVAQSDFGDPTTSTSYQVCLYDASGLKLSARAPVDGTCGNGARPCWSTLSTTGYRFKDRHAERSDEDPAEGGRPGAREDQPERAGGQPADDGDAVHDPRADAVPP